MDVEPYLADMSGIDGDALLKEWRWLLGDSRYTVFRATAMGDLIVQDASYRFHFLDMQYGDLRPLAGTESEMWKVLLDRRARKSFLLTFKVRELRAAGILLLPGQCYSPGHPIILGGSHATDNLEPCDLLLHCSIMGQIHEQVRDLPPGTQINAISVEPPEMDPPHQAHTVETQTNPWIVYAGIWANNPDFTTFISDIKEYRRRTDGTEGSQ